MQSVCADLVLQMGWENKVGQGSLTQRLSACLRQAMSEGALKPGSRLPATRDLARELALARNTVANAYEQLRVEGYVYTRVGSGTFVAQVTPEQLLRAPHMARVSTAPPPASAVRLSSKAQQVLDNAFVAKKQWGAFMPGVPDVTQFPRQVYARIVNRLWRHASPEMLTYGSQGGSLALKKALAEHLRVARSVECAPEQVLITEGVHQALDLTVRTLLNPKDSVWVEDPGYWGIGNLLRMGQELSVQGLAVDAEGMVLDDSSLAPTLIFTTPSHQYPLGNVMSLARRKALLSYARKHCAWIVEDDYDSEFRFSGRPIPAMQSLEPQAPVIYIGTFSKTLFPGIRVGYMVLPKALAEPMQRMHAELYRAGHQVTHQALAELINEGHYASHIRRMRVLYGRRRAFLLQLIERYLGKAFLPAHDSGAGLHLVLPLPAAVNDVQLCVELERAGLLARPLSRYYQHLAAHNGLVLGYAAMTEEQMQASFFVLLEALRRSAGFTAH